MKALQIIIIIYCCFLRFMFFLNNPNPCYSSKTKINKYNFFLSLQHAKNSVSNGLFFTPLENYYYYYDLLIVY